MRLGYGMGSHAAVQWRPGGQPGIGPLPGAKRGYGSEAGRKPNFIPASAIPIVVLIVVLLLAVSLAAPKDARVAQYVEPSQ